MKRRLRGYLMTAFSVGASCLMLIGLQPAIHEYLHAVGLERVYAAEQDILTRDLSKTILERVRSSQRDSNVKGRTRTLSGDGSSFSGTDDNAFEDVCVYEADAEGNGTGAEGTTEDSGPSVGEWVYYGNCRITHYDDCEICCNSDNRRRNLRICDPIQNSWSHVKSKNNTSGHAGVYFIKRTKRWEAALTCDGIRHRKTFEKKEDAINQRQEWEQKYFGEFALAK